MSGIDGLINAWRVAGEHTHDRKDSNEEAGSNRDERTAVLRACPRPVPPFLPCTI